MQVDVGQVNGIDSGRAWQSAGAGSRSDDRREGDASAGDPASDQGSTGWAATALAPFTRQRTVLLTTYRRNGTPVGTPVNIAVAADRAFVRTWDTTGKLKRIRNNPAVEVAPSTVRGRPTGPAIRARALILDGAESAAAGRALARKHPMGHGVVVPLVHHLRRNTPVHIELRPVLPNEPPPAAARDGGERLDRGRGAWPTVVSALLPRRLRGPRGGLLKAAPATRTATERTAAWTS